MKNEDVSIGMRVTPHPTTGIFINGIITGISSKLPLVNVWIVTLDKALVDVKGDTTYRGWTTVTLTPDLFDPVQTKAIFHDPSKDLSEGHTCQTDQSCKL